MAFLQTVRTSVLASVVPGSAQKRSVRFCRALIFGFGLTSLLQIAFAQESRLDFNIPAQSLATALEQYGNATGRNALYKSSLLIGRRSMTVQGHVSPDAALATLLEGTGLTASHVTPNSFLVLSVPVEAATVAQPAVTQYFGRIQVGLQKALCAAGEARPGSYRIGMRLWIDDAGDVTRFERLGSAGTSDVDERIDRTLRRLQIGAPPPPGLAQPISVVIKPQGPGVTMGYAEPAAHRAGVAP
jgi:hypothetical protein